MDEEQLERTERSSTPSLIGSSIRSADDSAHSNYIHPEKYTGVKKKNKKSILNSAIGASLDELINEGALLGSEEDFTKFLDDEGKVKEEAKRVAKEEDQKAQDQKEQESELKDERELTEPLAEANDVSSPVPEQSPVSEGTGGFLPLVEESPAVFSTPNLSEYQLDNQISDHNQFLSNIQSHDHHKLPSSDDRERSKTALSTVDDEPAPRATSRASSRAPAAAPVLLNHPDDLHTPVFYSEPQHVRPSSRSRSIARDRERLRSRSVKPHLARGDSYKNVHTEEPSAYELPADLESPEEETDERATRQSKPTMGESIAAAEATGLTRDPSLVTAGDYTHFDADRPDPYAQFLGRSTSSTNYLRQISRSRSRQPDHHEKNDADPEELEKEGALISDDPYGSILDKIAQGNPSDLKLATNDKVVTADAKLEGEDATELKGAEESELKETEEPELEDTKDTELKETEETEVDVDKPQADVSTKAADDDDLDALEKAAAGTAAATAAAAVLTNKVTEDASDKKDSEDGLAEVANEKGITGDTTDVVATEEADVDTVDDIKESEEETKDNQETDEDTKAEEVLTDKNTSDEVVADKEGTLDEVETNEKDTTVEEADEKDTLDEVETSKKETLDEVEDSTKSLTLDDHKDTEKVESEDTSFDEESEKTKATSVVEEENLGKDTAVEEAKSKDVAFDVAVEEDTKENLADKSEEASETPKDGIEAGASAPVETSSDAADAASAPVETVSDDEDFSSITPEEIRKHLESQPVYLFTSFAGGMQIVPRTNRLATILQANGVKFEYRDLGTDDEAKKIWKRSAGGKTLPGVVRGDDYIGNWQEIDEANEEYRLRELLYETL